MGRTSAVARWFSNAAARLKILLQARSLQVGRETNRRIQINFATYTRRCVVYTDTCHMRGLDNVFLQRPIYSLRVRERISADTTHSLWRWRSPKYHILEHNHANFWVQAVKVPNKKTRLYIRGKERILVYVHMKAPLAFHTWLRQ
jgi:hypothetical protein